MRTSTGLRILCAVLFLPIVFQTVHGQRPGRQPAPTRILSRATAVTGTPLASGIYTVGAGGFFPTLDSAFHRLSGDGIAGSVTLSLTDTLYTALNNPTRTFALVGPIAGASKTNTITIRPAASVSTTIEGSGVATLLFQEVSNLILDGVALSGPTRLLVLTRNDTTGAAWNDAVVFRGNCDLNIIRNITATTESQGWGSGLDFYASGQGGPDSCVISGNFIRQSRIGIYVTTVDVNNILTGYTARGNVIRGNRIGSPTDSLNDWGIQVEFGGGTIIEGNALENFRNSIQPLNDVSRQIGINVYSCLSSFVRNNFVHNFAVSTSGVTMTALGASGGSTGSWNWFYNNMVYDLSNRALSGSGEIAGFRAWAQNLIYVDNNTICLPFRGDAQTASAAAWLDASNNQPTLRNNIFYNGRNDLGSSALRLDCSPWSSNNNDLVVDTPGNGSVGRVSGSFFRTLADWQTRGSDQLSVSVLPSFCDLPCLHIDGAKGSSRSLDGHGAPIAGITTDFDGEVRDAVHPDIGADEFVATAIVPVGETGRPGEFILRQNYPNPFNPATTLEYTIARTEHVTLAIYDLFGRQVAVLVNEKKDPGTYAVAWNAAGLASGVYFSRLRAGNEERSHRMLLVK